MLARRRSVRSTSYGRSPGARPRGCSWRSTAATTAQRAGGTRSQPARTAGVRAGGATCMQLQRSSAVASHVAHVFACTCSAFERAPHALASAGNGGVQSKQQKLHGAGLPEEKAIIRTAVERGYAAVALGAVQQRKRMRCWANLHLPDANTDMNAVTGSPQSSGSHDDFVCIFNVVISTQQLRDLSAGQSIPHNPLCLTSVLLVLWSHPVRFPNPAVQTLASVRSLTEREQWVGLPLVAWGGSAGGTFVARLPYFLPLKVTIELVPAGLLRSLSTEH
jgi:hypothetical protein